MHGLESHNKQKNCSLCGRLWQLACVLFQILIVVVQFHLNNLNNKPNTAAELSKLRRSPSMYRDITLCDCGVLYVWSMSQLVPGINSYILNF